MDFFDVVQRLRQVLTHANQFPKEKIKHRWSGREYISEVERVFNEGSANCRHEWERVPISKWDVRKYDRVGGCETDELGRWVEIKRRAYVCPKCEAECLMLFSHVQDED